MSKELYLLNVNAGDGSYSVKFTFDKEVVNTLEQQESDGSLDYERFSDGDGFHYETLTLPDECTYESLGIRYPFTLQE